MVLGYNLLTVVACFTPNVPFHYTNWLKTSSASVTDSMMTGVTINSDTKWLGQIEMAYINMPNVSMEILLGCRIVRA